MLVGLRPHQSRISRHPRCLVPCDAPLGLAWCATEGPSCLLNGTDSASVSKLWQHRRMLPLGPLAGRGIPGRLGHTSPHQARQVILPGPEEVVAHCWVNLDPPLDQLCWREPRSECPFHSATLKPRLQLRIGSYRLFQALGEGHQPPDKHTRFGRIRGPVIGFPKKQECHGRFTLIDGDSPQVTVLLDPPMQGQAHLISLSSRPH